jgi:hypothetical protein
MSRHAEVAGQPFRKLRMQGHATRLQQHVRAQASKAFPVLHMPVLRGGGAACWTSLSARLLSCQTWLIVTLQHAGHAYDCSGCRWLPVTDACNRRSFRHTTLKPNYLNTTASTSNPHNTTAAASRWRGLRCGTGPEAATAGPPSSEAWQLLHDFALVCLHVQHGNRSPR